MSSKLLFLSIILFSIAVLNDSAVIRDQNDVSPLPSLPTPQAFDLTTPEPEANSASGETTDELTTPLISENNDDVSTTTEGIRTIGTTRFFPLNQHTHNGNGNVIGILADKEDSSTNEAKSE
ncbi:hypothetical protein M3Y94_00729100 [Aphelenchoides besseyi]|nr:hypothetical protein M3Y94_00727100 [Aphelenchoides besseyi]KAI6204885.1 hypothetical protein M3Y94_00729100 [Aphelenchoides besseyi]KAI6231850.1 hypothetical protein M3Y95_00425000 [Aphelenchoides besseyi]KAI6231869.1 hypothetical protein M3Y95_00427000 [Aphelenchoides besseyi]